MAANKATKDASPAVQNIIKNANGAKIALGDLQLAAKATRFAFGTLKTIGNAFVFAAIVKGLELVVSGIKKVIFARKEASEKADEEYEKSSEKVKQNEEEAKSLDNLIKKYEELRSKDDVDTSARKNWIITAKKYITKAILITQCVKEPDTYINIIYKHKNSFNYPPNIVVRYIYRIYNIKIYQLNNYKINKK